jgi:hypothetical protein
VASWFIRVQRDLKNFDDVQSLAEGEMVVLKPRLRPREEEQRHRRALYRLTIAEADESAMEQWRLMSTGASILVDSVGPPRAEVCRTAASFP